ncbi:glycosyltransferase family 4 protein [Desemzia sp. RIT804]|uniref:glycosyltransferase family 4 protein n=1 Tax=Desemzia sp. RIT 804 TaxID=2810209 RepID=UPI00194F8114|nr:glycosyltransferase family 4 protein [Desemzia sp. RIT 804]MBM6615952.1 glycosyltransferase family 4 protein [Desemzia sp. RIT 804]
MKVLHINSYYSNRFFYKNLYDDQIKQGIEVNVYVPVANNYKKPAIDFGKYTKISKNHGKYDRAVFQIKHRKILTDIKKQYTFDDFQMLHAHSLFSNGYIAYKIYEEYGVPYVVTARSTDLNTFFKYMIHLRKLGVEILKQAKEIIFLSPSLRDEMINKYIPENLKKELYDKSHIIPNGLDPFWLDNKNMPKSISKKNQISIIQVGIINKGKNALTTAKAIEILNNKGFNIKFNVIGKIENRSTYQELIKKEFVHYHSPMNKEKLLSVYRNNDIYVMPSIKETFGLVYAEALSQGLPVIYSKGQGFDKQFPDGQVGYPVEKLKEHNIAEKILTVIEDYEIISQRAIESCEKFDWNKITEEITSLYMSET